MGNIKAYDTERTEDGDIVNYIFVSKGRADIIKAIQYRYIQDFLGYRLYNLGFGDYDMVAGEIADDNNSNNGDVYTGFYTVLNTVQGFFETFPTAMLMVQGSDSTPEFEGQCRKNCRRHCREFCRKRNRRINVYREYVNKIFSSLKEDFFFFGGLVLEDEIQIESYEQHKE